ncbi:hypothetical protein ASG32_23210 [Methylobacterium sp. Leaf361]|nr:hypothetical protein ASG32_23210 [Methylobacterium sp. Leaf361]
MASPNIEKACFLGGSHQFLEHGNDSLPEPVTFEINGSQSGYLHSQMVFTLRVALDEAEFLKRDAQAHDRAFDELGALGEFGKVQRRVAAPKRGQHGQQTTGRGDPFELRTCFGFAHPA